MKTYHIINKEERHAISECKYYTFEQLKEYFEPNKEDFPELHKKWKNVTDVLGLEDYLELEANGMNQPYQFEEDEVENIEDMERRNYALRWG